MQVSGWVNWVAALSLALLGMWQRAPAVQDLSVCAIQGSGSSSPYVSQEVRTSGVVTLDLDQTLRKGFFMQVEGCDADPATSDAIYVYTGEQLELVRLGERVQVSGVVREYFGRTEIYASPTGIAILAVGQPQPQALYLSPPFDAAQALVYFEARESMLAYLPQANVVGPTNGVGSAWLVNAALAEERIFWNDPRGFGEIIHLDGSGVFAVEPQVRVFDQLLNIRGVIDYRQGIYRLLPVESPSVLQSVLPPEPPPAFSGVGVKLATFNLGGLYDALDDPAKDDEVWSAAEYQRGLQKRALAIHEWLVEADILAVQEVENQAVLEALVSRPELQAGYEALWFDGPDNRSLDVALLYRPESVVVLEASSRQACTALIDGLGPDGNGDVEFPANGLTCDRNGDGLFDGNRLFSYPPLLARLRLTGRDLQPVRTTSKIEQVLWVLAIHLESREADLPGNLYTQPRRLEQANAIAGLLAQIRSIDAQADVVLLGDFNDAPESPVLQIFASAGLEVLSYSQAAEQRYSFIQEGVSHLIDGILVDLHFGMCAGEAYIAHINSDFPVVFEQVADIPYRSSDHDPVMFSLNLLSNRIYLPLMSNPEAR